MTSAGWTIWSSVGGHVRLEMAAAVSRRQSARGEMASNTARPYLEYRPHAAQRQSCVQPSAAHFSLHQNTPLHLQRSACSAAAGENSWLSVLRLEWLRTTGQMLCSCSTCGLSSNMMALITSKLWRAAVGMAPRGGWCATRVRDCDVTSDAGGRLDRHTALPAGPPKPP